MSDARFERYFSLRKSGALREAYFELQAIMRDYPKWSKQGDLYVWCAEFELLLDGDADRALELLDTASELGCVNLPPYHSMRGAALCKRGDRREGLEEIRKSIAIDPSDLNVAALLDQVLEEDWPECVRMCQEILRRDSGHCMAHVCLAWDAKYRGDRDEAIRLAKDAERLAHSDVEFFRLGCLYHELEEQQSAIEAYLQADRLDYEEKGLVYAAVAACYFEMYDNVAAKRYLAIALEHSPDDEYVRSMRTRIEQGDEGD